MLKYNYTAKRDDYLTPPEIIKEVLTSTGFTEFVIPAAHWIIFLQNFVIEKMDYTLQKTINFLRAMV